MLEPCFGRPPLNPILANLKAFRPIPRQLSLRFSRHLAGDIRPTRGPEPTDQGRSHLTGATVCAAGVSYSLLAD